MAAGADEQREAAELQREVRQLASQQDRGPPGVLGGGPVLLPEVAGAVRQHPPDLPLLGSRPHPPAKATQRRARSVEELDPLRLHKIIRLFRRQISENLDRSS